jgi:autophagy-related protein 2
MPKRLLRYALSRLELLDADALEMDNLDLAIGRNTVFEFRDVGIKLKVGPDSDVSWETMMANGLS